MSITLPTVVIAAPVPQMKLAVFHVSRIVDTIPRFIDYL